MGWFPALLLGWFVLELLAFAGAVEALGALGAIGLMAATSLLGFALIRGEGLALAARVVRHLHRARETGVLPPLPVAGSLPLFIGGVLLLIPGFANDALAVLVLLPPLRGWIVRRVHRFIEERHHAVLRERGMSIDVELETRENAGPEGPGEPPDPWRRRGLPPPDPEHH